MLRSTFLLCLCSVVTATGQDEIVDTRDTIETTATLSTELPDAATTVKSNVIEDAIKAVERRATIAQDAEKQVIAEDELEKLYEKIVAPIENIIKLLQDSNNVYKFVEAKGIDRVILPNLHVYDTDVRMQLLILTKLLFDVAPTTTTVMVPATLLDKLLDIFEEDDNLALKARTVDILYAWLPDNPKIQARVMKLKGLEPFYEQVHRLDAGVIQKLLKLFHRIVKEHINARNEYQQKNKSDVGNLSIYKKIGLIERVSSDKVCYGLLHIFQSMWIYSVNNKDLMLPAFELIVDLEPYCIDFYRGKAKALDLFQNIFKQLKESGQAMKGNYENLGLNTTELELSLQRYISRLALTVKDEF